MPETTQTPPRLEPLRFGSLTVGFPVVQAALSGYSDWPMRVMAKRMGADYTLCEVMLDQFLVSLKDRSRTRHFLHVSDEEHPVGGQLMGAEPEQFAAGALKLVEAGFDVIDINFGCPVKKVLGRCRGGFHLSQPEVAIEIVQRTRDAVPAGIPVTVKMRRGIDDTPASRDRFFQILDGAIAAGIAGVTVHGRTVLQRYLGPSRWSFLRDVVSHVDGRIAVLGSGDLFTAHDCLRMMRETGVAGVTAARGAIGNPWIFSQSRAIADGSDRIDPPSLHEQRRVLLEHFDLSEQLYGGQRAALLMRKFGIKYAASHPEWIALREAFGKVRTAEDWRNVVNAWYGNDAPGVFPPMEAHKVQSGGCEPTD